MKRCGSWRSVAAITTISLVAATSALASPFGFPVALAGEAGSLGMGGQATMAITPWMNARLSVQGFGYTHPFNKDNTPYDSHLELLSYGALLDVYPLMRGARFSIGMMGNGNKVSMHANCATSCTANNDTVTGAGANIDGAITFNRITPYVGFGWSNSMVGSPFYFSGDFGVLFQGGPRVSLDASGEAMVSKNGSLPSQVNLATDAGFRQQLQLEQNNLASQVNSYRFFPVAMLTVGWRF